MKNLCKMTVLMTIMLMISLPLYGQGGDSLKAKLPVLTTSAGQSTDVNTLNVIMDQGKIKYDYCDVPTVKMIKNGVGLGTAKSAEGFHVKIKTDLEKYKTGTPYNSIILAIGASLKGMGASGLTIDDEINRLKDIIKYCKENKIFIIAVHPGGNSKRGAKGSNNEKVIDAVAPFADYLIAIKDSNKDGRFSQISKEKGIPFTEVKYALGIVAEMKKLFN